MRDLEAALVDARQRLQQHAGAALGSQRLPRRLGRLGGIHQCLGIALGVADVQGHAIGRLLGDHAGAFTGLAQRIVLAEQRLHGGVALGLRGLAIHLGRGRFGEGRPVAPAGQGLQRVVEQGRWRS